MKFYKTILILLFIILLSPKSYAMKYKYLCKGYDSRIILQFDENKKLVITNNQAPNKYKLKNGITYWHSLNEEINNAIVVNSFLFQKSLGKLAIDSHSFISGYNLKLFLLCDEIY